METDANQLGTDHRRTQTVSLVLLTVIAVGFALYFMRPVVLPLLFALFLYLCLTPLIDFQMRRLRLPYLVALTTTALLGTLILLVIIAIAASAVTRMAADLNVYQQQLTILIDRVSSSIPVEKFGGYDARNYFRVSESTVGGFISAAAYEFSTLISNSIFIVILTIFILVSRSHESRRGLIGHLESQVRRYITGTVLLSALTGLGIGLTLSLLGVRFAFVFGLFAFLLNFIPVLGPVVATFLPLPIVLLSPELSWTIKILAIAIPAGIEFVMGQIVSPKVIGRSLALHPVTVLLFLLFFQMIWGIGGAFMSTPIAAVVKIVFEHFPSTQPLAGLMAGDLDALLGNERTTLVREST
jgi:AI-2 transport protein TqsA